VSPVESPWSLFRELDAQSVKEVAGLAADITLLLDADGKVLDFVCGGERLPEEAHDWVGKAWAETVSAESRGRVALLLREAAGQGATRWIQVSHLSSGGGEIPVQYRALGIGKDRRLLAVGRELQAIASLQQQLVDAQQALEHDYWRYREMETRHRLLFRMVSEGILIAEVSTLRVVEANPAADRLLGHPEKGIVGRSLSDLFGGEAGVEISAFLSRLVAGGPPADVKTRRRHDGAEIAVSASVIRQEQTSLYLVRLVSTARGEPAAVVPGAAPALDRLADSAPDSIVLTDEDGHLLAANRAFLQLVQLPPTHAVAGESLERWLGNSSVDVRVIVSNVKKYGALRLFRTTVRDEIGATTEVEVSATLIGDDEPPQLGFFIRDIGRRLSAEPPPGQGLPPWLRELNEHMGRAPLRELVRESTEQIEKLCIEEALKLTGDNRAAAAELLGLSRQSLYVKLARYNMRVGSPEELEDESPRPDAGDRDAM
jgi:transcriptional regulator PpsR